MDGLANLDYRPTAFKLEWMLDSEADMEASSQYLQALIQESRPDLLHFSQFYYGALDCDVPRVVVAHSDVVSWWMSVHRQSPPETEWLPWYRQVVARGLREATAVVAPSICNAIPLWRKPWGPRSPLIRNRTIARSCRLLRARAFTRQLQSMNRLV